MRKKAKELNEKLDLEDNCDIMDKIMESFRDQFEEDQKEEIKPTGNILLIIKDFNNK